MHPDVHGSVKHARIDAIDATYACSDMSPRRADACLAEEMGAAPSVNRRAAGPRASRDHR